jgi:hypothetical protein
LYGFADVGADNFEYALPNGIEGMELCHPLELYEERTKLAFLIL